MWDLFRGSLTPLPPGEGCATARARVKCHSVAEFSLISIDADQPRNPNRHSGPLELLDPLLESSIGDGHALPQPYVFCPRSDDEALHESSLFAEVAKHPPAGGAIATARA